MAKRSEVYKCEVCGNIVEVLTGGIGELVCCEKPMLLLKENSVDAAVEKHVPVIEKIDGGYTVTVGEVPHPMEDKHYIEWVELIADAEVYRHYFKPGDSPDVFFKVDALEVKAREHCNLHGLWRS